MSERRARDGLVRTCRPGAGRVRCPGMRSLAVYNIGAHNMRMRNRREELIGQLRIGAKDTVVKQ